MRIKNEHEIIGGVAFVKASNTGGIFIVDAEDYDRIKYLLWRENENGYIISQFPGDVHILLHRLIMNAQKGEVVDHINHLKYDNRKDNLRVANQEYNMMNACGRKNNTSGRKGVWQDKRNGRWVAEIKANKKKINLGHYATFEEAVAARERGEEKYFGAWSYSNSTSQPWSIKEV